MLHDRQTIGLLGGSFNPAHEGHIHLSLQAMKRLKLDQIWWLVSPQNPLKKKSDLADYGTRVAHARQLTQHIPAIHVSDFEETYGLHYSMDTITAMKQAYPRTHFVWLMGADNLANFHRWAEWQDIFNAIPIAVFDRAPFLHAALHGKAAQRFKKNRIAEGRAASLARCQTPAWSYCTMPRHPQSATQLRISLGKNAFLSDNIEVS